MKWRRTGKTIHEAVASAWRRIRARLRLLDAPVQDTLVQDALVQDAPVQPPAFSIMPGTAGAVAFSVFSHPSVVPEEVPTQVAELLGRQRLRLQRGELFTPLIPGARCFASFVGCLQEQNAPSGYYMFSVFPAPKPLRLRSPRQFHRLHVQMHHYQ